MIYVFAIILGLAVSIMGFVSEIICGNISHLKNGREPNAGAAVFPMIPFMPVAVIGFAWILESFIPKYSVWVLIGIFALFFFGWGATHLKNRSEFRALLEKSKFGSEQ